MWRTCARCEGRMAREPLLAEQRRLGFAEWSCITCGACAYEELDPAATRDAVSGRDLAATQREIEALIARTFGPGYVGHGLAPRRVAPIRELRRG